jgi:hypothetical protein
LQSSLKYVSRYSQSKNSGSLIQTANKVYIKVYMACTFNFRPEISGMIFAKLVYMDTFWVLILKRKTSQIFIHEFTPGKTTLMTLHIFTYNSDSAQKKNNIFKQKTLLIHNTHSIHYTHFMQCGRTVHTCYCLTVINQNSINFTASVSPIIKHLPFLT